MMTPTIIPLYVVATVLTVYGIETDFVSSSMDDNSILLQQYLPFTVLKLYKTLKTERFRYVALQQYLPFTVLKHHGPHQCDEGNLIKVATVLTVYGIET